MGKGQFEQSLTAFGKKSTDKANQVLRKAVFALFTDIVRSTPVDTGRLRAAWQVGQNYSMTSELAETFSTEKVESKWGPPITKGYGRFSGTDWVIAREKANIDKLTIVKDGIIGYIYNNVRYGVYVEWGLPELTPARAANRFFVRRNLQKFSKYCAAVAAKIKMTP